MGTEQSKPRPSSCRRSSYSYQIINGAFFFANGDKYIGETRNGQLNGNGTYQYHNGDSYKGEWRLNRKHGYGIQVFALEDKKYVGYWQDNLPYGEGTLYYHDGSYYFGFFLEGEKHGQGVYHDNQGDEYEEEWSNGERVRRAPLSPFAKHNLISFTNSMKNRRGSKGEIVENNSLNQIKSVAKSEGDDKSQSEEDYSEKRRQKEDSQDKDDKDSDKILFKSQNDLDSMDVRTYDVGLETLNIIEHMEMLNSVAGTLLNKDVQDWTYKDVGDWLSRIGLIEYIENFEKNHIDGQVLFEINEADLKDEFNMTSVGHRKNFVKAVDNLKKLYDEESGKSHDYVKKKIQKFYEKNRSNVRRPLMSSFRPKEGMFFSNRLLSRHNFNSQHEVIDEDEEQEFDSKNDKTPSPEMGYKVGQFDYQEDEINLDDYSNNNNKNMSPKKKKAHWDADDELPKSEEELDQLKPPRLPSKNQLSKKSKANSDSEKSSPSKGDKDDTKHDTNESPEEIKHQSPRKDKESSNSNAGSSSESSSDSEPSDDEKRKKDAEEKPKEVVQAPANNGPKLTKASSKNDHKVTKKLQGVSAQNFKSLELPSATKQPSKKAPRGRKNKRNTQINEKATLNEKIKEEILRIFKDSGLNDNFIIDYNDISFEEKVGEGGYGRVFRGKFAGTDVAIKEYGKTKLDVRRAEDFVKEVEVISNLRHPNIVLCMGACIHDGKYLMITEYLEEGSLFDHLHKKHTKINDETMVNIIEDIALGMCYLHGRKVFHCDMKSSNILIDSNWNVHLCDFGLSRVKYKSDRKRFQKQRVGTPHWMAPEILRGEKYDESADVYSFGMILWELMTGEIPYYKLPISDIIATVGHEGKQIALPSKGNPHILSIMNGCLNLKKEERPTFKQIVEQLQRIKSVGGTNKKNKTWF